MRTAYPQASLCKLEKMCFCGGFGKVAELFLFENLILHLILDFRWIYIVE